MRYSTAAHAMRCPSCHGRGYRTYKWPYDHKGIAPCEGVQVRECVRCRGTGSLMARDYQ